MSHRLAISVVLALMIFSLTGCLRVGEASPDEKTQLDAWSAAVTDKDRSDVQRQAATHTEWMEKKRVQWMIAQYRTRFNHIQAKLAATRAATQASTQASTQSSTQPTTQSTTQSTTLPTTQPVTLPATAPMH